MFTPERDFSDEESVSWDMDESSSEDELSSEHEDEVLLNPESVAMSNLLTSISQLSQDQLHNLSMLLSVMDDEDGVEDDEEDEEEEHTSLADDLTELRNAANPGDGSLIHVLWSNITEQWEDVGDNLEAYQAYDSLARMLTLVTIDSDCDEFLTMMEIIDKHANLSDTESFVSTLLGVCPISDYNREIFVNIECVPVSGQFYLRTILDRDYTGDLACPPDQNMLPDIESSPTYNQQSEALHAMYVSLGWE